MLSHLHLSSSQKTPDTPSSQLISEDTRSTHMFISAHLRRHQILLGVHLNSFQKTPNPPTRSSQHFSEDTRSSHVFIHLRDTRSSHEFISAHVRRHKILPGVHLSSTQKTHNPPTRPPQLIAEDTRSSQVFISAHLRRHKILPRVHLSSSQ